MFKYKQIYSILSLQQSWRMTPLKAACEQHGWIGIWIWSLLFPHTRLSCPSMYSYMLPPSHQFNHGHVYTSIILQLNKNNTKMLLSNLSWFICIIYSERRVSGWRLVFCFWSISDQFHTRGSNAFPLLSCCSYHVWKQDKICKKKRIHAGTISVVFQTII